MKPLANIAQHFAADNLILTIGPLGNGLINDTYLVNTSGHNFVLQRINRQVFPNPELITANLLALNRHITGIGHARLVIPELLEAADGQPCFVDDDGNYWRAQRFIEDSESLECPRSLADAEQAGFALGHFHRLLSSLDPNSLHDTLPGFHITPSYLRHYDEVALQAGHNHPECVAFIACHRGWADTLENAKEVGLLPLRVIHGDPKLNNFLFAKSSARIISLIDLDTVKPGLVHYDIGDCLRSCCHVLESNTFDLDICAAILKNYLAEAGAFFSEHDYNYLPMAIRLIPFALGIRFYTDYLAGNRYFKVSEPEQNLHRACQQFQLCGHIIAQEAAINSLINQLKKHVQHKYS